MSTMIDVKGSTNSDNGEISRIEQKTVPKLPKQGSTESTTDY